MRSMHAHEKRVNFSREALNSTPVKGVLYTHFIFISAFQNVDSAFRNNKHQSHAEIMCVYESWLEAKLLYLVEAFDTHKSDITTFKYTS